MTDHPADQRAITDDILRRLRSVRPHVPSAKIMELPAFGALYDQLDTPHRLRIDKELREREKG